MTALGSVAIALLLFGAAIGGLWGALCAALVVGVLIWAIGG
jgi:hypothetical protein